MKTKALFFSALALLAIACTKENLVENSGNNNNEGNANLIQLSIFGTIEGSKTELGEDGKTVKWLPGDAISVYPLSGTTTKGGIKFTTTNGDGWFTNEEGIAESGTYYALYYWRNSQWVADKSAIQTKLFPDQYAKVGSFDDDLAYMAGKLDLTNPEKPTVEFKNICSHIRFTLTSDIASQGVKSLTLMGNNGETISGVFQLTFDEAGNPMTTPTDPDIYVRLYNKNDSNLEAGDYYFTVLPQTFKDGFTVIISKEDGTQIAAKTTKNTTAVSTRNSILRMGAPTEYKEHLNYFVQYLDGFQIEIGGQTINNLYENACLINTAKNNLNIGKDSIYFVHPGATANISYNAAKSLIVIGMDKEQRSNLTYEKSLQPQEGGSLMLFSNLACTTSKRFVEQRYTESFGSIIVHNCHFKQTNNYGFALNYTYKDSNGKTVNTTATTAKIHIEDCEFGIKTTDTKTNIYYFLNFGDTGKCIENLTVKNNILYNLDGTDVSNFKLLNARKLTVNDFDISNNTICDLKAQIVKDDSDPENIKYTVGNIIHASKFENKGILQKNYFINCQCAGDASATRAYLINGSCGESFSRSFGDNYVYSTINTRSLNIPDSFGSNLQLPRLLNGNPLANGTWKPAEGVFGPYVQVTYSANNVNVPSGVGAQRPDMVTPANTAAYRYAPNELGSF